ncbi:MAG TPA: hypothetical protein PLY24_01540 [Methanomassiliicoccales archaeon]|nr:hypothetical protein [Methanomassiliicoccales archaeon]
MAVQAGHPFPEVKEEGALASQLGIDSLRIGACLARVDISFTRPDEILGMIGGCPLLRQWVHDLGQAQPQPALLQ